MDSLTEATWRIAEFRDAGLVRVKSIGTGPFLIGRARDCDWVVNDRSVSRYHAQIFWRNGCWWVCDLASAGGTAVDGRAIGDIACRLTAGSRIQISGVTLVVFERTQLRKVIHPDCRSPLLQAAMEASTGRGSDRIRVAPILQRVLRSLSDREFRN